MADDKESPPRRRFSRSRETSGSSPEQGAFIVIRHDANAPGPPHDREPSRHRDSTQPPEQGRSSRFVRRRDEDVPGPSYDREPSRHRDSRQPPEQGRSFRFVRRRDDNVPGPSHDREPSRHRYSQPSPERPEITVTLPVEQPETTNTRPAEHDVRPPGPSSFRPAEYIPRQSYYENPNYQWYRPPEFGPPPPRVDDYEEAPRYPGERPSYRNNFSYMPVIEEPSRIHATHGSRPAASERFSHATKRDKSSDREDLRHVTVRNARQSVPIVVDNTEKKKKSGDEETVGASHAGPRSSPDVELMAQRPVDHSEPYVRNTVIICIWRNSHKRFASTTVRLVKKEYLDSSVDLHYKHLRRDHVFVRDMVHKYKTQLRGRLRRIFSFKTVSTIRLLEVGCAYARHHIKP